MTIHLSETDKQILARHSASVRGRALIELQVVDAIIKAAVVIGYRLGVEGEGGEEVDTSDASTLKALLFNLDDAVVLVFNSPGAEEPFGWIRLVFGNDGWDLVSDYSTNLEEFLAPVQAVADFWGD
jgi:hypothetical protein